MVGALGSGTERGSSRPLLNNDAKETGYSDITAVRMYAALVIVPNANHRHGCFFVKIQVYKMIVSQLVFGKLVR